MPYVGAAGGLPEGEPAESGCVLCRVAASDPDAAYVIWRGRDCLAVLNAFPYASGHLMVAPIRHQGDLEGLEPEEASELWAALADSVSALKAAYRPDGINLGANLGRAAGAGVPGHLHVHAVPRWNGDANFMTALAEARVLPEALSDSWARLRAAWPGGA